MAADRKGMSMNVDNIREGRGYAQVDLDVLLSNVEYLKAHLGGTNVKIIAVVKTDGYGHGSVPIAEALEKSGMVSGFAVATEEEALELVSADITLPVLILGYTFPYFYEALANKGIEATVFRKDMVEEMGKAGRAAGKPIRVHIKVDTGMSRIGIAPDEKGLDFVKSVASTEGIELVGLYTHFARADEGDKSPAYAQLERFQKFAERVREELGGREILLHSSNSAAVLEIPEANLDAVRIGIAMYGLRPSEEVDISALPLRPVLSFYSRVIYVKEVEEGRQVSYGGTYTAKTKRKIATIPIGYGDGYPRSLSGKGYVLIRGRKAPILGRICMDQMMVDVTDIPEVLEGDRVTLIGKDGTEEISADFLGELAGKFNYELVCGLGKRIPRIYYSRIYH